MKVPLVAARIALGLGGLALLVAGSLVTVMAAVSLISAAVNAWLLLALAGVEVLDMVIEQLVRLALGTVLLFTGVGGVVFALQLRGRPVTEHSSPEPASGATPGGVEIFFGPHATSVTGGEHPEE